MNKNEIHRLFECPFIDLLFKAHLIHKQHHASREIQKSTLVSIKTGKCPEDCSYCSQSAHFETNLPSTDLMKVEEVFEKAKQAKASGSTRLCMGSSGTRVKDGEDFERILKMVSQVKSLGMETCVTLGMLKPHQAKRLKQAGLDFYNHNLDTSPEYYGKIVSTRTFKERLKTLEAIREANIAVCTGGILGMGESRKDRVSFLEQLTLLEPPPESVTINKLVPIAGTPLEDAEPMDPIEIARTIAVARILLPRSVIRLSAGRETMSDSDQALCYIAGANSIFSGEMLLTTPNASRERDTLLFEKLGLQEKALI